MVQLVNVKNSKNWKQLKSNPTIYISNTGLVYNVRTSRYVKPKKRDGKLTLKVSYKSDFNKWTSVYKDLDILVAELWIENDDPFLKTKVEHIDGDPTNNEIDNLVWVKDYNNEKFYSQNIRCMVRNFYTKEVTKFNSLGQCKSFMGLRRDSPIECINYKRFGKLINDTYEFRFEGDNRPWFYEYRTRKVSARYKVTFIHISGKVTECFYVNDIFKEFPIAYKAKNRGMGTGIPALVDFLRDELPDYRIHLEDSFDLELYRPVNLTKPSERKYTTVVAFNDVPDVLIFKSTRQAAIHFYTDHSTLLEILDNPVKSWNGYKFASLNNEIVKELFIKLGVNKCLEN